MLHLVSPDCYFCTVDWKHAYYSVSVRPADRKWLRFMWKDKHYQFTCLPQGLTSAPRIFTKLLKPVLAHLRKMGMIVSCYIDDCIFIAPSFDELNSNIQYAVSFFDKLGLTVHVSKSSLVPSKEVEYLGCVLWILRIWLSDWLTGKKTRLKTLDYHYWHAMKYRSEIWPLS